MIDGFVIASTSIDQIYKDDMDVATNDNNENNHASTDTSTTSTSTTTTYQRASVRIAGFVGLPDGNGGTNLSLFIDSDGYEDTPSWLLRLLAQYELCEMMNRIRAIPSSISMSILQADDNRSSSNHNEATSSSTSTNTDDNHPIASKVHTTEIPSNASSSSTSSSAALSLTRTAQTIYQHNDDFYVTEGLELASKSIKLMKEYLGVLQSASRLSSADKGSMSLSVDWQVRVQKDHMTVSSATVPGSQWNAIRAITTMHSDIKQIVDLLIDDNRINEFDDMVDFIVPLVKVDARTAIRRIVCKPIWPTAPRDFIVCTSWTALEDGSVMVCSRSAPNDVLSTQIGYVRGFVNIRYVVYLISSIT